MTSGGIAQLEQRRHARHHEDTGRDHAAAWISAEMGVGLPSVGQPHVQRNWALFAIAPMNRQMQITVMSIHSVPGNVAQRPPCEGSP